MAKVLCSFYIFKQREQLQLHGMVMWKEMDLIVVIDDGCIHWDFTMYWVNQVAAWHYDSVSSAGVKIIDASRWETKISTHLLDSHPACSMCIQNLRQSIENNSYVVNETSVEVMQLKDFANFNNPMVDVSRSLQRTKVGDVPHQLI